jgi:hypothetical protein
LAALPTFSDDLSFYRTFSSNVTLEESPSFEDAKGMRLVMDYVPIMVSMKVTY